MKLVSCHPQLTDSTWLQTGGDSEESSRELGVLADLPVGARDRVVSLSTRGDKKLFISSAGPIRSTFTLMACGLPVDHIAQVCWDVRS